YYEMHVGKSPDNLHIREICELCKRGNGSISIEKGLFACCENGLLQIRKKPETSESFCMEAENCPFIKIKTLEIAKINNLLLNQAIDCDKITGKLIVRSRQAGDCLSISERGVTKTLKKLFNEAAVPPQKRNEVLVLCDDKGVLWVEGFGTDKRANVDDMTKKALIVERIL
ncbi:MAG: tRNA lysidine(34) synthetase TilS, partial [Oscillospiraceae bacterium]